MHVSNAISSHEIDRAEWVPTYYCEDCGAELHYPSSSGCCEACDRKREDLLAVDLGLHSDH